MPATLVNVSKIETASDSNTSDSWFHRALARRLAEEQGELVITGARFNSFI
jgi:hypothetical protein